MSNNNEYYCSMLYDHLIAELVITYDHESHW